MGDRTGIEWTEATWNPLTGCEHAGGPGCDMCYAAREAAGRLSGQPAYAGLAIRPRDDDGKPTGPAIFTGEVRLLPDRLDQPLRWKRPRLVFVNSMSDLFLPAVPTDYIADVFAVMARADWHTFQVLTKRPARMANLLCSDAFRVQVVQRLVKAGQLIEPSWPLPNVWLGTSIENDDYSWRAAKLQQVPAAVRWVSAEPLLGPLDKLDLEGIGWVVAGGESGPGARPMHPRWLTELRDRCAEAGVPFLLKQWGEWAPYSHRSPDDDRRLRGCRVGLNPDDHDTSSPDGPHAAAPLMLRMGKRAAGRLLEGRTHDEYPAGVR